jgi:ribosomal protein S18 acetylase RimI-like enzyme
VTTSIAVRRATRADADLVSAALADAFSDDPVVTWLLPKSMSRRDWRVRRLWSLTTRSYLRNDKPVYLTADGQGAALWAPPGTWVPSLPDQLRDLPPMLPVFGRTVVRASKLQAQMMKAHPMRPKHWYLYAIGARVGSQGRGLGSAMLREGLDQVDAAGEPAYLESSNIRNVPLYERHGFAVVEEITIAGGGPSMWRMWRDPVT